MFKLIIDKPGIYIDIPGLASFRTPATFLIKQKQINDIITELHKNDIQDYKIISVDEKKKQEVIKTNKSIVKDDEDILDKRFKNIEVLLEKILKRESKPFEKVLSKRNLIKQKDSDEEVDEFIPDVDIKGLKISNKFSMKEIKKSNKNVDESVNLLKQMKGKKNV